MYDVDSAGHTCQTQIVPNATAYHVPVLQTATISISGRPFFTATYLGDPSDSAADTVSAPSTAGVMTAADGAHVGAPTHNTAIARPSSLSQFGPKITDQV